MNERQQLTEFKVDDLVLVRAYYPSDALHGTISKFFEIYQGPFRVKEVLGKATYLLCSPTDEQRVRGKFNIRLLRQYHPRENSDLSSPSC